MKTILSFLFFGAILQTQAIAAGQKTECEVWRGKLRALLDQDAITVINPLPVKISMDSREAVWND
jgi:hypothetical protein